MVVLLCPPLPPTHPDRSIQGVRSVSLQGSQPRCCQAEGSCSAGAAAHDSLADELQGQCQQNGDSQVVGKRQASVALPTATRALGVVWPGGAGQSGMRSCDRGAVGPHAGAGGPPRPAALMASEGPPAYRRR